MQEQGLDERVQAEGPQWPSLYPPTPTPPQDKLGLQRETALSPLGESLVIGRT